MIAFPNAKINLGIRVLRKREDGFHDLETIFYPVPLCDTLEITPVNVDFAGEPFISSIGPFRLQVRSGSNITWSSSGNSVDGDIESNLCIKAFRLFDSLHPLQHNYFSHLHKAIPSGAGLGGGSSDAAFVLKMLNKLEGTPFDDDQLAAMSLNLGSDCPFFIYNLPALAFGRGELLRPVKIDLSGLYLILVKPPVHISTPDAFRNVSFSEPLYEKSPELNIPIESWNSELINSFESYVFNRNPEVKEIKNKLIKSGAIYASMSGSGSSVYGIFKKPVKLDFSDTDYFVFETAL